MSGSLGRASVDLDAELANLRKSLAEGQKLTQAWVKSVEKLRPAVDIDLSQYTKKISSAGKQTDALIKSVESKDPKLSVDTDAALRQLQAFKKFLDGMPDDPKTIRLRADADAALRELQQVDKAADALTTQERILRIEARAEQAEAELRSLRTELDRLPDTPQVVKIRADVDNARQQVEGFSLSLGNIAKFAAGAAAGIGVVNAASGLLGRAFSFAGDSMIGLNLRLEDVEASLTAMTKDGEKARQIIEDIRVEAAETPFAFEELAQAVTSLLPAAKQSGAELMELIELAEILAASNPAEGLTGAAFALREALSGDFTSVVERFNLSRSAINALKEEGVPALDLVRQAMADLGIDADIVALRAQTTSGKWATFLDNLSNGFAEVGESFAERLNPALDNLIAYTESEEFSIMLEGWASRAETAALKIGEIGAALLALPDDPRYKFIDQLLSGPDVGGTGDELFDRLIEINEKGGIIFDNIQNGNLLKVGWYQIWNPDEADRILDEIMAEWDAVTEKINTTPDSQKSVIHFDDMSVMVDDLGKAYARAAELGSIYYKTQVTADDVARGYIITSDGVAHSLDGVTRAAVGLDPVMTALLDSQTKFFTSSVDLENYGKQAAVALREQTREAQALAIANAYASDAVYTLADADAVMASGMDDATKQRVAQLMLTNELTAAQNDLAGAYQIGLQIQSDYTAQGSEYASQQRIIEEGNEVLKEQLDAGIITQDEYNREIERSEAALARFAGGQDDATLTARDYAIENGELMRIQDVINAQYPDLVKGSAEYNEKIAEAAREAGISQEAIDNMQGSNTNLAGVIADELVPALQDLINKILELDGKTADVTVRTNYTSTGSPGGGGVGLTEFARGGIVDRPTFALVGEDGPELVLPLTKPDRMQALLKQAGMLAMADGGGRMPSGRISGGSVELDLSVDVSGEPIDWSWLFAGLDTEAEDYADQAAKRIEAFVTRLKASDLADQSLDLSESIRDAELMRDALAEIGDVAAVDALNADIAQMESELAAVNRIMETDAVKAWNAAAGAAETATRSAEGYIRAVESLSNSGALGRLQQDARDAELALKVAIASGADPAAIASLQSKYDAANRELALYEQAFSTALTQGLFTQDELMALAQEGGDTLTALLATGMLSRDQIASLIATGNEGIREVLDGWFGSDVIATIEDGFNDISDAAYAQLLGMKPDEITEEWVNLVADGLTSGRLTIQQAMELLLDPDGMIPEEQQINLIETFEQLGDDLARALATGDGLDEAQAAYDRFMQFLIAFAEQNGLVVADILAAWDQVRDIANQPPAPTRPNGEMAEIGSGSGRGSGNTGGRLVIDPTRRAANGAQYLIPSGMLGADRESFGQPIDDLGTRLTSHWTQQTDRMVAAMQQSWVATSAFVNGASLASSLPSPSAAPINTGPSTVVVPIEIGGREVDRYIVDVVTGTARREIR